MRKSNLLLIAALAALLVSLGMHNAALKKAYLTAAYKDPYNGFHPVDIKDFQELHIKTSHPIQVRLVPGPYKVWIQEEYKGLIQARQTGNRLRIETAFPEAERNRVQVTISCPRLSSIHLDAAHAKVGNANNGAAQTTWIEYLCQLDLDGFTLDSLNIRQDQASAIVLANNKIGQLRSLSGLSPGAKPKLEILPGNTIREADLSVQQQGHLVVHGGTIAKLRYDFGDSTQVTFSGSALGLLKH